MEVSRDAVLFILRTKPRASGEKSRCSLYSDNKDPWILESLGPVNRKVSLIKMKMEPPGNGHTLHVPQQLRSDISP